MKILILFIATLINFNLIAQDNIIKIDGSEIKVKVTEVQLDFIKYKRFDNINGPTYSIPKSNIFMIQYENGTKDLFNTCSFVRSTIAYSFDTPSLPDSLIMRNGIYLTGGGKFGFSASSYTDLYGTYMMPSFVGIDIEVGGVLYFMPRYMPKHFGFGLNLMLFKLGVTSPYGFWPYTSSIGHQISFRAAKDILVDWYCKAGVSLIKDDVYFQPKFILDTGVDIRLKSLIIGASAFVYPNEPEYSYLRIRIGAFIPIKKAAFNTEKHS
ncbi:hypothetical protein [Aureispira sp. CCB-E]|uniref:hypothetical protein n=1 Tax=Aureispira sp. CCB-E TaxID=3051121 RepID=UPI002868A58E|nr:hypothetical protein [Aureispira sp. CCB-E]WMX15636.1 hypothetical protein QP953_04485 [Aureispira sp. CCB-E]